MNLFLKIKTFPLVSLAYIFSLLFVIFAVHAYIDGRSSEIWPSVEGVVTDIITVRQGENTGSATMGYKGQVEFLAVDVELVKFRYQINDKEYSSVGQLANQYKVSINDKINVFYDPDHPSESRLTNEVNWYIIFMWLFYAGIASMVGLMWYRYILKTNYT